MENTDNIQFIKAKEVKDILSKVSDDALILICDANWGIYTIVGSQEVKKSPAYDGKDVLYLDIFKTKKRI